MGFTLEKFLITDNEQDVSEALRNKWMRTRYQFTIFPNTNTQIILTRADSFLSRSTAISPLFAMSLWLIDLNG